MSYIFPIKAIQNASGALPVRLFATQNQLSIEFKIIPASGEAWAECEQWLAAVMSKAQVWIADSGTRPPVAILLIMQDCKKDMQLLAQLRDVEPGNTIFAVLPSTSPAATARALRSGADDVWDCAMPAPEAWARLLATVRRRAQS